MDPITTAQVVEIIRPKVVLESDIWGGMSIKLDDFTFVQINYDWRYTDNAHRRRLAHQVLSLLGFDPAVVPEKSTDGGFSEQSARLKAADAEYESWLPATPVEQRKD